MKATTTATTRRVIIRPGTRPLSVRGKSENNQSEEAMTSETQETTEANGEANGASHVEAGANGAQAVEAAIEETPTTVVPTPTGLRLRLKVWTDPHTKKRYLAPSAQIDMTRGIVTVHTVSEGGVKKIQMNPVEWNALPFHDFIES